MVDSRRMTTDRFYGGVANRLDNLRLMFEYIDDQNPSRSQLNSWVISNTNAGSEEAVSHHLTFLESIGLIELSKTGCVLAEYGRRWLNDQNSETLYEALSSGVKGFDTLLQALEEGPMSDEDIMELLVSEFEEAEMTKPGPAIRHREWLQVLGYVEREGDENRLTSKGRNLVKAGDGKPTTEEKDNGTDWLGTIRSELRKYHEQTGDSIVSLSELYDFSEHRLAVQFPENDNVRAKIRQQLQLLRDQDEVEFLDEAGTYRITIEDDIQQAKTELQRATATEPELTSGSEQYTKSRRRARDTAFKRLVTQAYDGQCAICGSTRETPNGSPEVEAAHIYPKGKAGSDDVRNGIALCRLHHWAFDSGWLSITDEYGVLVKDAPDRDGYYEFKQLEGEQIHLPDEKAAQPHQMFLKEHRRLNGFTDD